MPCLNLIETAVVVVMLVVAESVDALMVMVQASWVVMANLSAVDEPYVRIASWDKRDLGRGWHRPCGKVETTMWRSTAIQLGIVNCAAIEMLLSFHLALKITVDENCLLLLLLGTIKSGRGERLYCISQAHAHATVRWLKNIDDVLNI